jgi:RNA polymerase sigma factor (sigma-70 family)
MAVSQASNVFHCIRTLSVHQHDDTTDADLLDLYVRQKDESAFEALVRRHGSMVLGVCRRILGNGPDAEDAFQATFLVLVRKAATIRPAGMVGNWLYGVAHRTALEARRAAARRRSKEAQVAPRTETPDDPLAHLRPLLDQELTRLPDKYRTVLVLCDLEGRTRKEAAQQFALPEGTIASRQARARHILAKRLTRQGVTLSGGALATALAQEAASASAPLSLVYATVRAATAYAAGSGTAAAVVAAPVVALTEGVLRTMLLSKLKVTVVVLVLIGLAGTGWSNYRSLANDQPAMQGEPQAAQPELRQSLQPQKVAEIRPAKPDQEAIPLAQLEGIWTLVKMEIEGRSLLQKDDPRPKLIIKDGKVTSDAKEAAEDALELSKILDPSKDPKQLTIPNFKGGEPKQGVTLIGIYELAGDELRVCATAVETAKLKEREKERPKAFDSKQGVLLVFKRVSPPEVEPDRKAAGQGQARRIFDLILKGFQAYQDFKATQEPPPPPPPSAEQDSDRVLRTPLLRVPLPDRTMMTVALSSNGKLLAVAPHDKTTVHLWDVTTAKEHTLEGNPFSVTALAFSPDRKTLATGTGSWLPDGAPGEIKLWDVATGTERAALGRLPETILALAFSPDGKTLASASTTLKLWDVSSGKEKSELLKLKPREGACWSVAFAPDGKSVVVGVGMLEDNTPGSALLYDVGTGNLQATLPGHTGAVGCVGFAPDGKTLASADSRGTLKLWDVATAKERASFSNKDSTFRSFFLQSLAFASDSKTVVATMSLVNPDQRSDTVVLKEWNLADGKEGTIYQAAAKDSPKGFPLVVSGDASIVGLAGPALEGSLVAPGAKLELWDRRALAAEANKER